MRRAKLRSLKLAVGPFVVAGGVAMGGAALLKLPARATEPALSPGASLRPSSRTVLPDPRQTAALCRAGRACASSVVVVDAYREGNDEPVHRSSAGVLVTRNGYVFAPLFVVRDADFVIVSFDQETRCPARVLATDRNTQLAVLKAGAPPAGVTVPELSPAAAERLEAVVALVAPKAAGGRALPGKIMVTDRNAGPFQGVLEVELQGEPGPLGGILLDQEGRLAGMAVGTVAPEGETGGAGAGRTRLLVIPSSQMRQSLDRILTGMPGTDLEGERELLTS